MPDTRTPPESAATADYAIKIIRPLRKIMQLLDVHSRKLLKEHSLTIPQLMCLYGVFDRSGITVAQLAENIHVSSSTLIGIIDRLEEKKLLRRARSDNDRRQVFVHITDKGQNFVLKTPYLLHNRLHDALEKLPAAKQEIIAQTLAQVAQMLEQE